MRNYVETKFKLSMMEQERKKCGKGIVLESSWASSNQNYSLLVMGSITSSLNRKLLILIYYGLGFKSMWLLLGIFGTISCCCFLVASWVSSQNGC